MRIRPARPEDLDAIERLGGDFAAETGWPRRPIDAAVRAALAAGGPGALRVFLAEDDAGSPVAFASVCAVSDLFDGRGAILSDIYVAPSARRTGVGRALVEAVAANVRAAGGGWLTWHVGADAAGAQAFYRRVGATLRTELAVMSRKL